DALQQNIVASGERAADLIRLALIIKDERVNVAVACVENIRNAQSVFLAAEPDELHDLRQFGARHNAILGEEIGAEPANGAEGALTTFPEVSPFLVGFGSTNFAG